MLAPLRMPLLASILCLVTACAGQPKGPAAATAPAALALAPEGGPWSSPLDQEHVDVGSLWMNGQRVRSADVLERALRSDVVYLGEKHDNADHHRLQAALLRRLVEQGARPALVLEMVEESQAEVLDELGRRATATPEDYRTALHWDDSGWPAFALYAPLFTVAIDAKLRVVGGNAARELVKRVAFGDAEALSPARRQELGLDTTPSDAAAKALELELAEAHCGMLPARALAPMAQAQRLRDATLAWHARTQPTRDRGPRAVVIAGAGHARKDRGAPWNLQVQSGASTPLTQLALAFVEVGAEHDRARDGTAFDVVWLTPRANDVDHCAEMAAPRK